MTFTFAVLFATSAVEPKSIKVFILAGDESMLRQGSIDGASREAGRKPDPTEDAKKPGTLFKLLKENPRYSFLQGTDGKWAVRNDGALYDAHPRTDNTRDPAKLLQVPADSADPRGVGVGVEHTFGHVVGEKLDDPVLLPFRHQASHLVPAQLAKQVVASIEAALHKRDKENVSI